MHPGGIKTAVARNATVTVTDGTQALADFFDRRLALHIPVKPADHATSQTHSQPRSGNTFCEVVSRSAKCLCLDP